MADAVKSYEGTKPYIFISYAHRDSGQVLPVLARLCEKGYRIWYDDGIAPGSEWPENIAEHLNGCYLTLAFVSPNSIASDNCRREVTFALSKRKNFLAILLEPTEMSLGMEMQLSAQQCIMKYGYASEESFYDKLFSCPYLAPCLEEPARVQEAAVSVKAPETGAETKVKPVKADPERKERKPAGTGQKAKDTAGIGKKKGLIAAIAAGAVGVVVLAALLISSLTSVKFPDGKKVSVNDTFLSFYGQTVTEETVNGINRMKKLESLSFSNCEFSAGALSGLALPESIRTLSFSGCTGLDTLAFLPNQTGLMELTLKESGIGDALLPALSLGSLKKLNLSGNPGFTALDKLSGCGSIQELDISGTGVASLEAVSHLALTSAVFTDTSISDLSPIAGMTGLSTVNGANSAVRNIDCLTQLENLTTLDFTNCEIGQINGVFRSLRLSQLRLGGNALPDLSAFANCSVLRKVELYGNPVTDVSVLKKNTESLEVLNLRDTCLSGEDLGFLKDCTGMTELYLDGVALDDLDMLRNMAELKKLSAVSCGVQDISGLSGCGLLMDIRLADNQITQLEGLQGLLPDGKLTLDLGYNPLRSLSGLPEVEYRVLSIVSDELNITTLPQVSGNVLVLNYTDALLNSRVAENTFLAYDLIGCPADRVVEVEDALGAYRLRLLDSAESVAERVAEDGLDYSFLLNP